MSLKGDSDLHAWLSISIEKMDFWTRHDAYYMLLCVTSEKETGKRGTCCF